MCVPCSPLRYRGIGAPRLSEAHDRRSPCNRRLANIVGDCRERGDGPRLPGSGRIKRQPEVLKTPGIATEPTTHGGRCPAHVATGVALVARVRHAQRHRLVGTRHTHAVVAAIVDDHVGGLRHVAVHALSARRAQCVMMVRRRVVLARSMTLAAHGVAFDAQLLRVRVMAVAAGDTLAVHPALQPRTPDEDFVALLAVDVIQPRHHQRRQVVIHERRAGAVALGDLRTPRMALRADLELTLARTLAAARCVAARGVNAPRHAVALVELHCQAACRVGRFGLGRGHVRRARAMTRLATDRDLLPCGAKRVAAGVVALHHFARVAIGAHEVPVLRALRPVQLVAEIQLLVRILAEPALTARGFRARVPAHRQCLQASARQLDQVLLKRLDTERVLDFEIGELAVGSVGAHEELVVAPEEARRHAVESEFRPIEIAEHGVGRRVLHRASVLRGRPFGELSGMAALARAAADEHGLRRDNCGRCRCGRRLHRGAHHLVQKRRGCDQGDQRRRDPHGAPARPVDCSGRSGGRHRRCCALVAWHGKGRSTLAGHASYVESAHRSATCTSRLA